MTAAGKGMTADLAEQPDGYERLVTAEHAGAIAEVAARIAGWRPRYVVFTARGTSDHAALYAAYLTEIRLGIPAGLASPSVVTLYGARPDLRDALVVGVSQSGGSSDLVEVITAARASGAHTLAVTNNPRSPLAGAAELHVDVAAGHERAVAATPVELAPRYRFAARVVTTGRGYAYPTARETALKLMETSYVAGLAFSGADLLHGPLAMTDPDVPVIAVVGAGPGGDSMREVVARLGERRADVVCVGPSDVDGARLRIDTPAVDERYAPLLDILPLQRLALALALARGEDPDAPRGLNKVTVTF